QVARKIERAYNQTRSNGLFDGMPVNAWKHLGDSLLFHAIQRIGQGDADCSAHDSGLRHGFPQWLAGYKGDSSANLLFAGVGGLLKRLAMLNALFKRSFAPDFIPVLGGFNSFIYVGVVYYRVP